MKLFIFPLWILDFEIASHLLPHADSILSEKSQPDVIYPWF